MRLGTKSCVECRRRKVRCIFSPGQAICQACALHDSVCDSQQLVSKERSSNQTINGYNQTNQRLDELSDQIRHICNAIGLDLQQSTSNAIYSEAIREEREQEEPEYQTEDVPLLRLFKDSNFLLSETHNGDAYSPRSGPSHQAKAYIQALVDLTPSKDDLALILRLTEPYWAVCPVAPSTSHANSPPSTVPRVQQFIHDSMKSGKPAMVAKAALWLACCIQHLPKGFDAVLPSRSSDRTPTMPPSNCSRNEVLDGLLGGAEVLVSIDADSGGTLEGVESGFLQCQNYVSLGRPRKAWSVIRRAINSALLIGLPRKCLTEYPGSMWPPLWQTERQIAMLLGLPYAVASSHPSISEKSLGLDAEQQAMHDIAVIVGAVIDRNQNYDRVAYSDTQQMHDNLRRTVSVPLDLLLSEPPSPSSSLAYLYHRASLEMYHLQTLKYIHLPYSFKSAQHTESEAQTIDVCRRILHCYQNFRTRNDQTLLLVCDLLDFQAFSAAMVLVIHQFRYRNSHMGGPPEYDWNLIHQVTKTLTRITATRDCAVSSQSVDVLTYFSDLYYMRGSLSESREIVVPYFGKIRVTIAGSAANVAGFDSGRNIAPIFGDESQMQVDISSFGTFSDTVDFQSGAELASDWMDSIDWQGDFDWNWNSTLPFD
ncbi:uncharacterized protein BDZ99DRAFT_403009 [Mytilinidion resinicola]|uniref:Zn(2)-C6 fungal-type domain-containing protein n=1 Tax=Mytilinidion resinicola TaxID=574789 RepID=A0A6A6XYB9_9PEZI|nr:uncharacterized protein BDZ99DRAFT_403009 [Mytilinidion resinicola]KAF2801556.1 hypothetical protein BDZ99DRAFT_403009 [Mytilinidion resinicola]